MIRIKLGVVVSVLALAIITFVFPPYVTVNASEDQKTLKEKQVGYGRGGRVQAGSPSEHAKEAIQPIPLSFDYDRAKVELGKKLFLNPDCQNPVGSPVIPVIISQQVALTICHPLLDINGFSAP